MRKLGLLIGTAACLISLPSFAAKDLFNRTELGSNWTVQGGQVWLDQKAFTGFLDGLATFTPAADDNEASVLVKITQAGPQQVGISIGDVAKGKNAYMKILSNSFFKKTFSHVAFYVKNNSDNFGKGTKTIALTLPAFSAARFSARLVGSVGTIEIDTDLDGTADATYEFDYGKLVSGRGIGLGAGGVVDQADGSSILIDSLRTRSTPPLAD